LSEVIRNSKDPNVRQKAINEIVEGNLRIPVKLAIKYLPLLHRLNLPNLTVMDLIQAGNLGVIRSAEDFDGRRGVKFISYAYPSVNGSILSLIKESRLIRIPENHFKYIHEIQELEEKYGKGVSDETIISELHMTPGMLKVVKEDKCTRIDWSHWDIEDGTGNPIDIILSVEPEVLNNVGNKDLKRYLHEKINQLKPTYRDVMFYNFFGTGEATLKNMAEKFKVSRERIRQIIASSLSMLRKLMEQDDMFKKLGITKEKKNEYKKRSQMYKRYKDEYKKRSRSMPLTSEATETYLDRRNYLEKKIKVHAS
jgi:RNA polymerase primary sigma factor